MGILDIEAPEFEICPANQILGTNPGQSTAVAVWQDPNATDNSGDKPEVTCDPVSGSKFNIGNTLVACEAIDSSGNNKACTFQIGVIGTLIYLIPLHIQNYV